MLLQKPKECRAIDSAALSIRSLLTARTVNIDMSDFVSHTQSGLMHAHLSAEIVSRIDSSTRSDQHR